MFRTSKLSLAALLFGLLSLAAQPTHASAQNAPPTSVGQALRSLASRAGAAFAGQVVSIDRKGSIVEIVFRVDQPILGTNSSAYTLREFAGLWPPGQHRYVVGQRVLIFLHPTGSAGLSSPVDGMAGIIPIVTTDAAGDPLLDVRRLAANLVRAQGQPLPSVSSSGISLSEATQLVSHWREPLRREPILRPLPLPQPPASPIAFPNPVQTPTLPRPILQPAPEPIQ